MPAPPLVSIVTPVLNGARFLPDCLRSVRAQTHPRVEHIVVDGGSTDGTLDLLRAAPRLRWTTGRDAGLYDAVNRGLRMAEGDLLAYQNSDDRYAGPDAIATAVDFLERRPDLDVAHGDFRWIDERGAEIAGRPPRRPARARDALLSWSCIPPHAAFVRRQVVHQDGLWLEPTLQYAADWDWFVRMYRAGKRFGPIERVLAEFRRHPGSKTSAIRLPALLREWRRVCRRNHLSLARVAWHELFYVPLRLRLGLAP